MFLEIEERKQNLLESEQKAAEQKEIIEEKMNNLINFESQMRQKNEAYDDLIQRFTKSDVELHELQAKEEELILQMKEVYRKKISVNKEKKEIQNKKHEMSVKFHELQKKAENLENKERSLKQHRSNFSLDFMLENIGNISISPTKYNVISEDKEMQPENEAILQQMINESNDEQTKEIDLDLGNAEFVMQFIKQKYMTSAKKVTMSKADHIRNQQYIKRLEQEKDELMNNLRTLQTRFDSLENEKHEQKQQNIKMEFQLNSNNVTNHYSSVNVVLAPIPRIGGSSIGVNVAPLPAIFSAVANVSLPNTSFNVAPVPTKINGT